MIIDSKGHIFIFNNLRLEISFDLNLNFLNKFNDSHF
jgi:hypothetical protein